MNVIIIDSPHIFMMKIFFSTPGQQFRLKHRSHM
nr:MAG TPA: hypothetical protein [Caudoviricetes sp.]